MGIPTAVPISMADKTHSQLNTWCASSVPVTAISIPISPAKTPRRDVAGVFIHLSESMNSAAETM